VTLDDLIADPGLSLRPLACHDRLDRPITDAFFTDMPDPTRYLKGGELILTGLMWRRGPFDSAPFVAGLAGRDVAAIGAGEAIESVPDDLVEACDHHGVPLVAVPEEVPLSRLMSIVLRRLDSETEAPANPAGSYRALLTRLPDDARRTFRHQVLGKLVESDDPYHTDLLTTLSEFLACSGSWTVCAHRLHMHVNTLRYRISRIEELTGRDLSSLDDRVDLLLALNA